MEWLLIGTLLGSTITSQHATQEACEGRRVMLEKLKAGVRATCVQAPGNIYTGSISLGYYNTPTVCLSPEGRSIAC